MNLSGTRKPTSFLGFVSRLSCHFALYIAIFVLCQVCTASSRIMLPFLVLHPQPLTPSLSLLEPWISQDGGWMRIGEDDQQCYVPGGLAP